MLRFCEFCTNRPSLSASEGPLDALRWRSGSDAASRIVVALVLLGLSAGLAEAQTLYGIIPSTFPATNFVSINTTTGAATLIGPLGPTVTSNGLAFRGGKLYTFNVNGPKMTEIDPATGGILSNPLIGFPPLSWNGGGVAFRSDGIGFLGRGQTGSQMYSFDIIAGTNTLITGAQNPGLSTLACSPTDVLYGVVGPNLNTVNQTTGALTVVGPTGIVGRPVTGLTFTSGGTLYATAIMATPPFPSFLYTINTTTGTATLIGSTVIDGIQSIAFGTGVPAVAGVTVTQSAGSTNVAEGGATDTYTVVLTKAPTANVAITINSGAQLTVVPALLTFTAANWNIAQTVTVSAVDDAVVEGPHTGTITHTAVSADAAYNAIAIANVVANITDNEVGPLPPPPPVTPAWTGGNEGSFPGSNGPRGGGEGGFGFGGSGLRAAPILLGPCVDPAGGFQVFNVSHRQTLQPAETGAYLGIGPLGWTLLAGFALGLTFCLVKCRST